ncbi:unnamed protein product [Camellia sinensis]
MKTLSQCCKDSNRSSMTWTTPLLTPTLSFLASFSHPPPMGFTEVKSACCGLGNLRAQVPCVPVAKYCSNRSDHVFWDLYHPTEAAAHLFVNAVFDGSQQFAMPMNVNQLIAA